MNSFYTYSNESGEIIQYGSTNLYIENSLENCTTVEIDNIDNIADCYHDLVQNVIVIRPEIDFSDSVTVFENDVITIPNVPNETRVVLDNEVLGTVTDGIIEISIPISGNYELRIEPPFPFKKKMIQVEVTNG